MPITVTLVTLVTLGPLTLIVMLAHAASFTSLRHLDWLFKATREATETGCQRLVQHRLLRGNSRAKHGSVCGIGLRQEIAQKYINLNVDFRSSHVEEHELANGGRRGRCGDEVGYGRKVVRVVRGLVQESGEGPVQAGRRHGEARGLGNLHVGVHAHREEHVSLTRACQRAARRASQTQIQLLTRYWEQTRCR